MVQYTVISDGVLTGTITEQSPETRLAWIAILFEAEKLRGKVQLTPFILAKKASISIEDARTALEVFQSPDENSTSAAHEGRRLLPIEGEPNWYTVTTWEKHAANREVYFARLRQQRHRARKAGSEA